MHRFLIVCALLALGLAAVASAVQPVQLPPRQTTTSQPSGLSPVPLDTQEDMIAYDSAPAVYWPGLTQIGTMWAVRFTPIQACTLTYIQVVSYPSSGSARIHVWSDDGGVPGTDLITPFNVTLQGNIQYQQIALPESVNIGAVDFHAGVEYTRVPPPFVTGDNNGNTEQRSKYKTPSGSWTALDGDLNFRAFVRYYGDDQVPPVIDHVQQVLGFTGDGNHPFEATITDDAGVASATIHYSLDGSTWNTVAMTNISGNEWEGSIPGQTAGTTVLYYLTAIDSSPNSNEATEPPTAPGVPYAMEVVRGTEIKYDDGRVDGWWIVDTSYNQNAFAIRMTPTSYPMQVLMARAFVNDDTPFDFTINAVAAGVPGAILPGGEAITLMREPHGWAIGSWADGPTIASGSFFLVFHWHPATPDGPGVGQDADNVLFRSYWYHGDVWNLVADGEWMMRAIVDSPVGIEEISEDGILPAEFQLIGNYPNPFNPSTEIEFLAPVNGHVKLEIYNIVGQHVKTLLDGQVKRGIGRIAWDGTDANGTAVTSGVYFYRLVAGDKVDTQKMVLLK